MLLSNETEYDGFLYGSYLLAIPVKPYDTSRSNFSFGKTNKKKSELTLLLDFEKCSAERFFIFRSWDLIGR